MCKFAKQKNAMFPKFIKIVLAALTLGYAVYQFMESNIGNGIALIFLAGIFVFLYFKNELILLSFLRLRKQDFEGTMRWLQRIKNPQSALTTKQQGYYFFLHGVIESQKNLTKAAFKPLRHYERKTSMYWVWLLYLAMNLMWLHKTCKRQILS